MPKGRIVRHWAETMQTQKTKTLALLRVPRDTPSPTGELTKGRLQKEDGHTWDPVAKPKDCSRNLRWYSHELETREEVWVGWGADLSGRSLPGMLWI